MKSLFTIFLLTAGTVLGQYNISGFIGNWSGTLEAYNKDSLTLELPMELNISERNDTSYHWQIVYKINDTLKDVRDYVLYYDSIHKSYAIDEFNGIVMYANLIHGALHSCFSVSGSSLCIRYLPLGDELHFELFSFGNNSWESGTKEGDFKVDSYRVSNFQKAILVRKD